MKKRAERAPIETSLSTLQLLVSKAQAIFDLYRALAALEQLVDHVRDCKDERAKRCSIILCQCRPLLNSPAMQSVLIKLVADKEEAGLAQVSLFLSEKISFWNSGRYDRETTLDILWSRERRGRLYYSGIREPSNIEGSEGLLSGYEGRAIGSKNRANSSGSFLYLRRGGNSSFYWSMKVTSLWNWSVIKPFWRRYSSQETASDLGKVKTQELLHFHRTEGLLFNHVLTKSPLLRVSLVGAAE